MPPYLSYMDFPFEIHIKAVGPDQAETGKFEGYASVFDDVPDDYGDIIVPGAFKKTLAAGGRNGNGIVMLWQHWTDAIPGVWDKMTEDSKGLFGEGRLLQDTQLGHDTYVLVREGAVKGLSIGFDLPRLKPVKKNARGDPDPAAFDVVEERRYLKELILWETSLVSFPAKVNAGVTGVKDATDPRSLERALRDAGLSRAEAKYIVSGYRFDRPRDADEEDEALVQAANQAQLEDEVRRLTAIQESLVSLRGETHQLLAT